MADKSPLFPKDDDGRQAIVGTEEDGHLAADLIRQKLAKVYEEEPNAAQEMAEVKSSDHRSRHQEFMYQLGASGKDLATIQTEWHDYYQKLSADEQHQVWQEFYASQSKMSRPQPDQAQALADHKRQAAQAPKPLRDIRSAQDVQEVIRHRVSAGGKLKAKHHLQSLMFGLGMGLLVIVIFLFSFFNEVFIAPFIQPGRTSANTPLIVGENGVAASSTPEVIIPKINLQIPADYSQTSTEEDVIEGALENGIVHYPSTVRPGEQGNAAFFGHSSNNIFNKGKYKFAFVLLRTLVPDDTFYLTYDSKVYVYKVISKTVVPPSQVSVLGPVEGQTATATLITCDPPGTSLNRLVIVGKQISPDPAGNTTAVTPTLTTGTALPGNGPTLWSRFIGTALGKIVVSLVVIAGLAWGARRLNRYLRY